MRRGLETELNTDDLILTDESAVRFAGIDKSFDGDSRTNAGNNGGTGSKLHAWVKSNHTFCSQAPLDKFDNMPDQCSFLLTLSGYPPRFNRRLSTKV